MNVCSREAHWALYDDVKTLQGLVMLSVSVVLWVQGFSGSMVQWFRGECSSSRETEVERESLELQVKDEDKTKV